MMVAMMISCNKVKRNPYRTYMPDMSYSRAYETYASTEALEKAGAHYNSMPVPGTIARGDIAAYMLANDSIGYAQSAAVKSPVNKDSVNMTEAERLYLVNCGICHGSKLDGNGPLYNDGKGPFPNAPKNFMADEMKKMAEGTMFHSVTYGKNSMGSYASQLSTKQRWQVIAYIKSKQGGGGTKDSAMAIAPKRDTTIKKVK